MRSKKSQNKSIKLGIIGSSGRLGTEILKCLEENISVSRSFDLLATLNRSSGIEDQKKILQCDMIIEVSRPEYLLKSLKLFSTLKRPLRTKTMRLVIGSTGWSQGDLKILRRTIKQFEFPIIVLLVPNFSVPLNLLFQMLESYTRALGSLIPKSELPHVHITDVHHIHKKDSPSGTANRIKSLLTAEGLQSQVTSVRSGEVIGEHRIDFYFEQENISIVHKALNRRLFALGALQIAMAFNQLKTSDKIKRRFLSFKDVLFYIKDIV